MHSNLIAVTLGLALAAGISEPKIFGVVPDKISTSAKPQQITINGDDFRGGLTLAVTRPGGEIGNLSGADISGLGAKTFRASILFDAVGAYELVVTNGDGGKSPPFRIDVRAGTRGPSIERITPAEATRGQEAQVVTLAGNGFEQGMKVSVTDPTGTVTVKDVFDRLEPQVAVLRMVFEMSGSYALMVTNPSGGSSNTVSITIR